MHMRNPLTRKSNSLEPTSEELQTPNTSSTDYRKSLLKLAYSPEKSTDPLHPNTFVLNADNIAQGGELVSFAMISLIALMKWSRKL